MSQEQPRRPSDDRQAAGGEQGAVRYGDVFPAVSGGLSEKLVAPQDAATMQSAESQVFGRGQTLRGGPAATMHSAATTNERMGVVGHDQATDATAAQGVAVSETRVPGGRLVTEFVAGQVKLLNTPFLSVCSSARASKQQKFIYPRVLFAACWPVPCPGRCHGWWRRRRRRRSTWCL
jgi:hypothetical protein